MAAKSKSKQQEALQFLDDIDNLTPPPDVASGAASPALLSVVLVSSVHIL